MSVETGSCGRVFLATTALEKFWDTSIPIIFMGAWCLLFKRRSYWSSLGGELMKSPYEKTEAGEDAYSYISRLYEIVVPLLADRLNRLHKVQYSNRYWQIMLGPWLQLYLSSTYDHYLHIQSAKKQYPEFVTFGMANESFVTPVDTMHLVELLKGDSYNLQVYTKIMSFLGISFSSKPDDSSNPRRNENFHTPLSFSKFIKYSVNWVTNFCTIPSLSMHLQAAYFARQAVRQLMFFHIGKLLPRSSAITRCNATEVNLEYRASLEHIALGSCEFERYLIQQLPSDIPQCFVEGFSVLIRETKNKYWRRPKAIFSSNSWYFDEHFKQWAAGSSENGSILLGTQHGGGYGVLANKLAEDHETAVVDYFYSWGWQRQKCNAKVIPMPATNFIGVRELGANNSKSGILWVTAAESRYLLEMPRLPINFAEYLNWQILFLKSLPHEMLSELRLRPHYEDHGWGIVDRLKQYAPALSLDSWSVSFWDSLSECRIYVCDHLSTTYAQALAANKPTILFFNERYTTRISAEAEPYFDMLQSAGILCESPEAAAIAVAAVYGDVEKWWNDPLRQDAIRNFCDHFAHTSPNALPLWNQELSRILAL